MKVFEQEAENNDEEGQHHKCDLCEKNFFNSSFLLKSHLSKVHKGVEINSSCWTSKIHFGNQKN